MNHQNNSNSTSISAGEQAAAAISGLCFLLGISGNIAVVVYLVRHFKRDNFFIQLMLNLAASDILSLLTLPVWMYSLFLDWTMGLPFCRFISFVIYTCVHASAFTVTLMSVHRYVLVLHRSLWTKLGQQGETVILMGVWLLAGVTALNLIINKSIIKHEGKLLCEQVVKSQGEKVSLLLPPVLLVYFVPLTILITSYLCLQLKVNDRTLTSSRLAPLVTAIIVTFFICFTPYAVVSIMIMAIPSQPVLSVLVYRGPRIATQSIILLNTCVNPLLYAFNFRALRQTADKNVPQTSDNS